MRRRRSRGCRERNWRLHVRREEERLARHAQDLARSGLVEEARMVARQLFELASSTRVKMPRRMKRGFCKRCKAPLIPGSTARVRLATQGRLSYVVVTCLACGWVRRIPYKKGRISGPEANREGHGAAYSEKTGKPEEKGSEGTPREG